MTSKRRRAPTTAERFERIERRLRDVDELAERVTELEDNAAPAVDRTLVEDIVLDLMGRKRLEVIPKASETKGPPAWPAVDDGLLEDAKPPAADPGPATLGGSADVDM